MQHNPSRSEKRAERYSALMEKGQMKTLDYLYKSEIRKLEKSGCVVTQLTAHPSRKSLWFCEVIFPRQDKPET